MTNPRMTEDEKRRVEDFAEAVLHGTKSHRRWLLDAADAFNRGEPLPKQPTGHHINEKGEFQSDKYPHLPVDKILLSFRNPASHAALAVLAQNYVWIEPELAEDIRTRLASVVTHPDLLANAGKNTAKTLPIMKKFLGGDA